MSQEMPYYYADGGKFVLFLDLLGFTQFVRQSFQVPAGSDDRFVGRTAALEHFKLAQREVDRLCGRFHRHLGNLLRKEPRRGRAPSLSMVFSDCA